MATPNANDDDVRSAANEVLDTTGTRRSPDDELDDDDAVAAVAARRGLQAVEPLRPELAPGESVMTVPDRFCEKCQEPRGGRTCAKCQRPTVPRLKEGEVAEEYTKPPLTRVSRPLRQPRFRQVSAEERAQEPDDELDDEPPEPPRRSVRAPRPEPVELELDDGPVRDDELEQNRAELAEMRELLREMRGQLIQQATGARRQGERMAPRQQQVRMARRREVERDEHEFDTPSRQQSRGGRRGQASVETRMAQQWDEATINLDAWTRFYGAVLTGARTVEEVEAAAELADEAYIQMMQRQHSA